MSDRRDENTGAGGLDEALQREIDEALGGRSAEELLDELDGTVSRESPRSPGSEKSPMPAGRPVEVGQVRRWRVVDVDPGGVLVDLGGKDQGVVPLEQFDREPEVGDGIELAVVRYDRQEDLWVLSLQGAVEKTSWELLHEDQIVEAVVEGVNKGGLEVRFSSVKAFMPLSQISLFRVEDPVELVGQKIRCQVVEIDKRQKRVIVSARALLEIEAQRKREELLAELAEGDVRDGVVRQVMPYGAFVDLGGVDGLVHVSQMSYERVEDPAKVVKPGQAVRVKVLKMDPETGRISLGMKQIQPDPWEEVQTKYPSGGSVKGLITRLESFGAFCRLEPGLEGLIPIGEITWSKRLGHPSEMLTVGQEVEATVLKVEPQRRRISLSVKQAQANPWSGASRRFEANGEYPGRITRLAEFGAFVELEPGIEALVHVSELADRHIKRPGDVVRVDQEVIVRVLEVDEQARRISASLKGMAGPGESSAGIEQPAPAAKKRGKPLRGGLD